MHNKLEKNKAFTLIELIVVIAVLGVLVLLAAPKFLGYTEDAKEVQIKNDVRVSEDMLALELAEDYNFIPKQEWEIVETQSLQEYADLGDLYDREGEVEEVVGGEYYKIPKDKVTTEIKGEFIAEEKGKVYYHEEGLGGEQASIKYTVTFLDNDGNVVEEIVVKEGESIEAPEVPNEIDGLYFKGWDKSLDEINSDMTVSPIYSLLSDVDLGMEDDFEWVSSISSGTYYNKDGDRGYFKYVGTGEEIIELPYVIDEVEMTSYYRMFYLAGKDVKKVISTNESITTMNSMFEGSRATELDLSSFDTSSVIDMSWMFRDSQATELDLSSFDTSNVTNMNYMFSYSQTTTLDLSSFDTSNVTNMSSMFSYSQATTLDLSSFDTSKLTSMSYMFYQSQATKGYARTTKDANKFNASSNKPGGLKFEVKQ